MTSKYKRLGNTSRYFITEPIVWDVGFKGNKNKETVPKNYTFDVSIPWFARLVFDRHNRKYFKAAALHDYLLEIGYDRISAAGAFNHGLKAEKVNLLTRFIMTAAVFIHKFK